MVVEPVRSKAAQACPDADELALLRQWHALHSGVRRLTDDLLADVEAGQGLAPSSFQALMFLVTAPGQAAPMNQLSAALGFSTAGTTKLVDRLADAGLVERRPSDADRRVVYTALTSAGAESVLAASRDLAQALRTRVVAPLGEDVFLALSEAVGSLAPSDGDVTAGGEPAAVPPCR
ncbi:DNA-binding transcriptional regulator, MarR family [Actinacidiphila yanglinensis]|uniref:DNA-binding transcriptional regulator, MarR family n=1 Tax=Actinacidiphila yanglinensis TaxID=310779 RepID=A0A1H6CX12_9ACTN|nr:MarR family winged helix-turn-helix transcriptional regulator [Actinacidiphila yanglinensis]SEG77328.1 DNA-binding transcriptional regulator, MarR family [Actinacidiphila yanglinensis]